MSKSAEPAEPALIAAIKNELVREGISILDVAKATNTNNSQLYRFLNGDRDLTLKTAARLFDHLGLRVVRNEG